MREGAWLVAFLVAQRLVELCFAQFNTGRLRAMGGVEFGAAHYPLMIALHASWLLGLWLLGHDRSVIPFWLAIFVLLQVSRLWVIAKSSTTLDNACHCFARLRSGFARTISLAQASELSDRYARNCGGSTGARLAAICFNFFCRQCCAACLPNPHRKRGAGHVDHILKGAKPMEK